MSSALRAKSDGTGGSCAQAHNGLMLVNIALKWNCLVAAMFPREAVS